MLIIFFFNQYKSLNFVHYEQSFKTNIVFRKEISQLSTISRKSWSRRKHLTNWLIYQNVLTDWSKDYLFFKKYNRFSLIFQMFRNSFLSYNTFLIKKLNVSSSSGSEKIVFSTLSSKIINYCSKYSSNFYTFLQYYRNINWLYVTTPTKLELIKPQITTLLNPILHTSQSTFNYYNTDTNKTIWFQIIYQSLFITTMSKLMELYKLNILLCLSLLK